MRIRKDKTSWKASGVIARDARATKDEPKQKRPAKRKDTKRWCRGKVGKEHQPTDWLPICFVWKNEVFSYEKRCSVCSKILNTKFRCLLNKNKWETSNDRW